MRDPRALASPVTRMGSAPLPDALDVGGACEVIVVAWLLYPAVLAGGTRVGIKEGLTVFALTFGAWTSHWPATPQANDPGIGAWKEENDEAKSAPKKIEEHGRRG